MKKLFKKPYTPAVLCLIAIFLLIAVFVVLFFNYNSAKSNLAIQQVWASGKESFDNAYEIAAMDKETPEKSLYISNFKQLLGKRSEEVVACLGQGAKVAGSRVVGSGTDKIESEVIVNLTNESANVQKGTPTVILGVNHAGIVVKISMSCNTSLLGYGQLSFIDLINNEHIVEKTITEAGLTLEDGTVVSPKDRSTYTQYASDGVTVVKENASFNGSSVQDKTNYLWTVNLSIDYSLANSKGDLAYTVRTISFSIELA